MGGKEGEGIDLGQTTLLEAPTGRVRETPAQGVRVPVPDGAEVSGPERGLP